MLKNQICVATPVVKVLGFDLFFLSAVYHETEVSVGEPWWVHHILALILV